MIKIDLKFFNEDNQVNDTQNDIEILEANKSSSEDTFTDMTKDKEQQKEETLQDKKILELQEKLDNLTKEKMSAEELKQYELSEKEKAIEEKEKILLEKENKLYAIKAIKKAGLDDGSDKALSLVEFVMDKEQEKIDEKVNIFNSLLKSYVSSYVDLKFKENGRVPNGAVSSQSNLQKYNNIAEKLGKRTAEINKNSNDILKYYLGGL